MDIEPLAPRHASDAAAVIIAGLTERWGSYDPAANPDLADLLTAYDKGIFLVALQDRQVVGTGALVQEDQETGRVVRMSVLKVYRKAGIGAQILTCLEKAAFEDGYRQLVLETTSAWEDAKRFYSAHAYEVTHHADGDTHFRKTLR